MTARRTHPTRLARRIRDPRPLDRVAFASNSPFAMRPVVLGTGLLLVDAH